MANIERAISKDGKKIGVIFVFFGIESRPNWIPIENFHTGAYYANVEEVHVSDAIPSQPPKIQKAFFRWKGRMVSKAYGGRYPLMEFEGIS